MAKGDWSQNEKYENKNPIAQKLVDGFISNVSSLVNSVNYESIFEIGSADGFLAQNLLPHINHSLKPYRGADYLQELVYQANLRHKNNDHINFDVANIYNLSKSDYSDLVLCCEVLEHLEDPELALKNIKSIKPKNIIISVPNEPIWRILNMVRGKYWSDLGNTPGHLNNWSSTEFIKLVSKYFKIKEIKKPLPWTILLCENY